MTCVDVFQGVFFLLGDVSMEIEGCVSCSLDCARNTLHSVG